MASKSYHLPQEQEAKGFREAASASEGNLGLYDSVLGKPSIKPEPLTDVRRILLDLVEFLKGGNSA
jgi:hypothetical protein